MARRSKPTIDDELIGQLLEGREHSAALLGNDGLIGELKKRLAERMLSAEMDVHLDDEAQQAAGNHRNGYSHKSVSLADDPEHCSITISAFLITMPSSTYSFSPGA
jgi:putative transposase